MKQWWQIPECELTPETLSDKRLAFYNTFYGSEEGRQVMLSIKEMCYKPQRTAEETLARITLFHDIRAAAGNDVDSAMASIEAEAKTIDLGEQNNAGND